MVPRPNLGSDSMFFSATAHLTKMYSPRIAPTVSCYNYFKKTVLVVWKRYHNHHKTAVAWG